MKPKIPTRTISRTVALIPPPPPPPPPPPTPTGSSAPPVSLCEEPDCSACQHGLVVVAPELAAHAKGRAKRVAAEFPINRTTVSNDRWCTAIPASQQRCHHGYVRWAHPAPTMLARQLAGHPSRCSCFLGNPSRCSRFLCNPSRCSCFLGNPSRCFCVQHSDLRPGVRVSELSRSLGNASRSSCVQFLD